MRHKVEQSQNSGSAPLFWHCSIILDLRRYQDADRVVLAVMVCEGSYGGLGVAFQGNKGGKGGISCSMGHVLRSLSESQFSGVAPE